LSIRDFSEPKQEHAYPSRKRKGFTAASGAKSNIACPDIGASQQTYYGKQYQTYHDQNEWHVVVEAVGNAAQGLSCGR